MIVWSEMSGQRINRAKSQFIFGTREQRRQQSLIKRVLHVEEGRVPFKYLGMDIGVKRLPYNAFDPLL